MNLDQCTIYSGPAMIKSRGDSDSAGIWVKIELPPELGAKAHPFRGYERRQIQLAAVLCDDNGKPVRLEQSNTETAEEPEKPRRHLRDMDRSQQAALMCKTPAFQAWIIKLNDQVIAFLNTLPADLTAEEAADAALKFHLGIGSKRELDNAFNAPTDELDRLLTTFDTGVP